MKPARALYVLLAALCALQQGEPVHGTDLDLNLITEGPETPKAVAQKLVMDWQQYRGAPLNFIEVAEGGATLHSVLASEEYTAWVVALLGETPPARRNISAGEPYLTFNSLEPLQSRDITGLQVDQFSLPDVASMFSLKEFNAGAAMIEAAIGRPLHAFRLAFVPFSDYQAERPHAPVAVWDVSDGQIYMDDRILGQMLSFNDQVGKLLSFLPSELFNRWAAFIRHTLPGESQAHIWGKLVAGVVPAVLLGMIGSGISLWFCIACPVLLGLLAPFLFNAGLGAAANAICTHYKLPDTECNDVWYAAFGIAMLLSLAAAVPIIYICQIPKCGRIGF